MSFLFRSADAKPIDPKPIDVKSNHLEQTTQDLTSPDKMATTSDENFLAFARHILDYATKEAPPCNNAKKNHQQFIQDTFNQYVANNNIDPMSDIYRMAIQVRSIAESSFH